MPPSFDLQSHSTHSDGTLPPAEVVARAAEAGVELLALTDHDTVDGVAEAVAAGKRHGVRVVPGVEMTAMRSDGQDVHVLGYGVDREHQGLQSALLRSRGDRERRIDEMARRLEAAGFVLDRRDIELRRKHGETVGRPQLYHAVRDVEANAAKLADEGIADQSAFFAAYIGEGGKAWVPRTWPTVADAIEIIHSAGGVAVWAHPFFDVEDPQEVLAVIESFREHGLDGIECFYVQHKRKQVELLCDYCEEHGLLRTGSADFHGPDHEMFSKFRAFKLHDREPELGPIGEG